MIFYNWKHQQIFIETGLSTSLFALLCDQWDEEKLRLNHTIISLQYIDLYHRQFQLFATEDQ